MSGTNSIEDRGLRALAIERVRQVTGLEERTAARVVLGVMIAGILIPVGIVAWVFWKGRKLEAEHGPDTITDADVARLRAAGESGGQAGLALEALARGRERRTMWTPFGPVPNIGGRLLPPAASLRSMGSLASTGIPRS